MSNFTGKRSPHYEVLCFTKSRISTLEKKIERLGKEKKLLAKIVKQFEPLVCKECMGEGYVMRPIRGCECDGPRMHVCHVCSGGEKP